MSVCVKCLSVISRACLCVFECILRYVCVCVCLLLLPDAALVSKSDHWLVWFCRFLVVFTPEIHFIMRRNNPIIHMFSGNSGARVFPEGRADRVKDTKR